MNNHLYEVIKTSKDAKEKSVMQRLRLKPLSVSILTIISALHLIPAVAQNEKLYKLILIHDTKHDISMPLKNVPAYSLKQPSSIDNPVELKFLAQLNISAFQGIGTGLGSYVVTTPSPDVSGGVGKTQFVQWVDPDLAIFDKITGQIAPGFPKPGNAIWAGFGGACETSNSGTPNVKFDQLANRWVLTRQAYNNSDTGPFYQCIAVSTTEDATGSYYRYSFQMDSLNNYGKIALWPDGYYMGMHMYGPASFGPRACVFDRSNMLIGSPATAECFQLTDADSAPLLPSDLGGTALPPAGMDGYLFSIAPPRSLLMFRLHADFSMPANAYLSSPIRIPVADFNKPCAGTSGQNCIVQPGTSNKLDTLGDRFTARIVYRRFGEHGSFIASHNIQGPPPKLSPAFRWYELRVLNDPLANPVVYQQQDFAPNSMSRNTGNLGIDKTGNIAIGYTVSSTAVHPSPEIAYRNYFDPLDNLTLQALYTGLGSQTGISAWSLSSAMSLDPVDNCTFWYSGEYLKTTGSFNWSTIVTHFKLPSCV